MCKLFNGIINTRGFIAIFDVVQDPMDARRFIICIPDAGHEGIIYIVLLFSTGRHLVHTFKIQNIWTGHSHEPHNDRFSMGTQHRRRRVPSMPNSAGGVNGGRMTAAANLNAAFSLSSFLPMTSQQELDAQIMLVCL